MAAQPAAPRLSLNSPPEAVDFILHKVRRSTSAPGLGSPSATSAPGLGSPRSSMSRRALPLTTSFVRLGTHARAHKCRAPSAHVQRTHARALAHKHAPTHPPTHTSTRALTHEQRHARTHAHTHARTPAQGGGGWRTKCYRFGVVDESYWSMGLPAGPAAQRWPISDHAPIVARFRSFRVRARRVDVLSHLAAVPLSTVQLNPYVPLSLVPLSRCPT